MFLVGICDDAEAHREHLLKLCEQYFQECPMEREILEFSSGEEVLAYQGAKRCINIAAWENAETFFP